MVASQVVNHNSNTAAANDVPETEVPNGYADVNNTIEPLLDEVERRIQDEQKCEEDDSANEPPSKKRKVIDTPLKTRLQPRGQSPPWRLPAVQGPSSFTVNGVRKSSRTNGLPLELQPPSNKRQTRAKASTAYKGTQTNGFSRGTPSRRGARRASAHFPLSARRRSATVPVKPTIASTPVSSTLRATPRASTASRVSTLPSSTPRLRSRALRESLVHPTIRRPRVTRRSGFIEDIKPEVDNNEASGDIDEDGEEHREGDSEVNSEADEDDGSPPLSPFRDDFEINTSSPIQKIKLVLRMPPLPVLHPQHIPQPRKCSSFTQWLDEYDPSLEDEDRRLSKEQAKEEALIRLRILDASQPGGVLSEDKCSMYKPEPPEEPPPNYGQWDFVVAHALYLRKLIDREQRQHRLAARKLAYEALDEYKKRLWDKHEKYYRSQKPRTQEELEQEEITLSKVRYRQLMKDLDQLWNHVRVEVHKIRLERWEEEQKARGKQVMNEMLDQSTLILNQQRARMSPGIASEDYDSEASTIGEHSNDQDIDTAESGSDDDESGLDIPDDERDLSQEALRKKYQDALNTNLDESDSASSSDQSDMSIDDQSEIDGLVLEQNQSMLDQMVTSPSGESTPLHSIQQSEAMQDDDPKDGAASEIYDVGGIDPSKVTLEEVDDVLLDSDDDNSDEDDSEQLSDSGTEVESGSEMDEDEGPGLLGFFSRHEIQELKETSPAPIDVPATVPTDDIVNETADILYPMEAVGQGSNAESEKIIQEDSTSAQLSAGTHSESSDSNPGATSPSASFIDEKAKSSVERQDVSEQHSFNTTPEPTTPATLTRIPVPHLLRGTLREYQHDGLDWLSKLYATNTNGILADEMGLGKTIQTISLLAHLAVDKEVWGPHLVVVPTSVMLNWEMEFKKWCPGFKVLSYYGDVEERKRKRKGWLNDDFINVCITSYNLVLSDAAAFKKRAWHYMILDEAHNIKNFQSQRWQTLLTFRTHRRLLLTGTPLQNNLIELWSLLYFLMPSGTDGKGGFTELASFTNALSRPAHQILDQGNQQLNEEDQAQVTKFHEVLRPFLLRRLKADVEKQMPSKTEHVVYCRLSKRQRQLYDGFMGRADTRATLASGNYMSIMNCLMSLRKVCNHPDLFETRQIVTSFSMSRSVVAQFEIKDLLVRKRLLENNQNGHVNLDFLNLRPTMFEHRSALHSKRIITTQSTRDLEGLIELETRRLTPATELDGSSISKVISSISQHSDRSYVAHLQHCLHITKHRLKQQPIYGQGLVERLDLRLCDRLGARAPRNAIDGPNWYLNTSNSLLDMVPTLEQRAQSCEDIVRKFCCVTPAVVAEDLVALTLSPEGVKRLRSAPGILEKDPFHESRIRLSIAFPDKRLLQYDCGKLQRLDKLLRRLIAGGHRALIFTQMTKILDILEQFLNIHGYRYLRLDGATKIEQRQALTERFQSDPRIPVFILSSRSGGLGLNLTGADTVIFYDMDWNPAMDKQCQDRAHRIGQTRDVHIYKFVSEYTIEANILRKSNQKRLLDDVIIQKGDFTTDYFHKISYKDALDDAELALGEDTQASAAMDRVLGGVGNQGLGKVLASVEDQEDTAAAQLAQKEIVHDVHVDDADFADSNAISSREPKKDSHSASQTPLGDGVLVDLDEERPHVDEFMVKYIDWELKDIPVAPPIDAIRKKKKKAWDPHIRRRR